MKVRIDDTLFLNIKDTSFGTLSEKIAFVRQLQAFKKKHQGYFKKLTPRETEILTLLAAGNNNLQVSSLLDISRRTVENHRRHINRKLRIRHQRDLIMYAMAFDLIPSDNENV